MILPCKHAPDVPPHDHPSSSLPIPPSADGDVVVTSYEPRRSDRVGEAAYDLAQADGDTWVERIAVCEGGAAPTTSPSDHGGTATTLSSNQLVLRSYFRNQRTRQRAWDEPPSGASNIAFATADDRRDAELRRKELQDALDAVPPDLDRGADGGAAGASGAKPPTRGGKWGGGGGGGLGTQGLLGRFRKNHNNKASAPQTFRQLDESKDLNLQKAIARSMADQGGRRAESGGDSPPLWFDPDSHPTPAATQGAYQPYEDDEDVALAKALSLSESAQIPSRASSAVTSNNAASDEEAVLQRVLEESRRDAERAAASMSDAGVAVLPSPSSPWEDFEVLLPNDDNSNKNRQASPPSSSFREDLPPDLVDDDMYEDDERWNRKMPAKPSLDLFDPFAFSSPPPSFSPANMVMDDSSVTATPEGPTSRKALVAPSKPSPATKATNGRGRLFGRMTGGSGSGSGGRPKSGSLENDAGLV